MRTSATPARSWRRVVATALATVLVVAGEFALLDTVYHRGDDVRPQQVLQAELHGVLTSGPRPAVPGRARRSSTTWPAPACPPRRSTALDAGLADVRADGRTDEAVAASEAVGDAVRERSASIDRQANLVYAVLLVVVSIGWFLWFRRLVQRHRALQQRVTAQESLEASEKRLMALGAERVRAGHGARRRRPHHLRQPVGPGSCSAWSRRTSSARRWSTTSSTTTSGPSSRRSPVSGPARTAPCGCGSGTPTAGCSCSRAA